MRADIGGQSLVVAHLPRRQARGRLFTASGRSLLIVALAASLALAGLGALIEHARAPSPSATALGLTGH